MVESEDYSTTEFEDMWIDDPLLSTKKGGGGGGGGGGDKKRRFSEEQVKSLELMFETQTKLEPRKKLELAKDLGLHPRQVAIWFQNKRARWKSKQLEREYSALRADYDALLSKFESLQNEKQLLSKQLQKLAELIDKPIEARGKKSACSDEDQKLNLLPTERKEMRLMSTSDDEENRKEVDLFNEQLSPIENSLVPTEQQFCFHQTNWPSEQSSMTPQWWEHWPMNE